MDPCAVVSEDERYLNVQFSRLCSLWEGLFVEGRVISPVDDLRRLNTAQKQLMLLLMLKLWPQEWRCVDADLCADIVKDLTESLNGRGPHPLNPRGLWADLKSRLTTRRLSASKNMETMASSERTPEVGSMAMNTFMER